MNKLSLLLILTAFCSCACRSINETSRRRMEPGVYKVKDFNNGHFFVELHEDTVALYPVTKNEGGWVSDTSRSSVMLFQGNLAKRTETRFVHGSFDIDILTILFKYRPYSAGISNQLNTNFNAAGFMGYRSDLYLLSYEKNPLNRYVQRMNRFAYSVGLFAGLGATQINPFMTGNMVLSEYDGLVWNKGVAGLLGVGEFTFGAALGIDHLIDRNRRVWIYEGKPWLGFTVGFNIN